MLVISLELGLTRSSVILASTWSRTDMEEWTLGVTPLLEAELVGFDAMVLIKIRNSLAEMCNAVLNMHESVNSIPKYL